MKKITSSSKIWSNVRLLPLQIHLYILIHLTLRGIKCIELATRRKTVELDGPVEDPGVQSPYPTTRASRTAARSVCFCGRPGETYLARALRKNSVKKK